MVRFDKSSNGPEPPLEKRCVAALTDDMNSEALTKLLAELTPAITKARQNAAVAEDRALDPSRAPDLKAAREQRDDALLLVGRLETLQSQLQRRLAEVREQEEVAAYEVKRDKLQNEGDALASELRDTYRECATRIIDVFELAKDFQARAHRTLGYPPSGSDTLRKFDNAVERLLEKVVLLNFVGEQIWPTPQASLGVAYVESMQFPSHTAGVGGVVGPGWETEEVREQFRVRHDQEQERQKAAYTTMAKDQEERMNSEERERFLAARKNGT